MCLAVDPIDSLNESTPRGGDSAKKRRLSESDMLMISQAQMPVQEDAAPPTKPVPREQRESTERTSQSTKPATTVIVEDRRPTAMLRRDEEQQLLQEAKGQRPEVPLCGPDVRLRPKRTLSQRRAAKRCAATPGSLSTQTASRQDMGEAATKADEEAGHSRPRCSSEPQAPSPRLSLSSLAGSLRRGEVGPPDEPAKYLLQDLLGAGAQGTVHQAYEVETGCSVALKTFTRSLEVGCYEEAAMQAICEHPYSLHMIETFTSPRGKKVLVMELARCDLLQHLQNRGPLCEGEARSHFRGLVSALQEFHETGWCHRDIKLENLLLAERGLLLGDFGSASPLKTPDGCPLALHEAVGSMSYMAPEVIALSEGREESYDGASADFYSLAVVLYAMIAGEFPFEVASAECTRYRQFVQDQDGFDWPPHFGPTLIDLLRKMLAPAYERARIAEIVDHKWFRSDKCWLE